MGQKLWDKSYGSKVMRQNLCNSILTIRDMRKFIFRKSIDRKLKLNKRNN